MTVRREGMKTRIVALLGSGAKYADIAAAVGCSKRTVIRVAKEIRPELEEVTGLLAEYQTLLRKRMPIRERVELYDKIARKVDRNPFAAMRALERIDDLDGILPAKDRARRDQESPQEPQPMFVLPAGAQVCVNVIRVSPRRKAQTTDPGPGLPAIDIKAEQSEEG